MWNAVILDELEYHEAGKLVRRGDQGAEAARRARHLVDQMRAAFDDAEVEGWEGLEGTYGLPDPDDEHVVAAAVVAGVGAIITHNLRDFPSDKLPSGIEVLPPQEFAANTVALDPARALVAVTAIAERSGRKGRVLTIDEILAELTRRYRMGEAAKLIRRAR